MKNWVVKADFGQFRYMAASIQNEHLLDQSVAEAMIFDIQRFLGMALFYDIAQEIDDNNISAKYDTLLNGGAYKCGEETIYLLGLKSCLCLYAFARYTKRDGIHHTATGVVHKQSDFSEPISDKTRQRLSSDDTALAEALKLECIDYLNRNSANIPLWRCTRKKRNPTFRTIGL